MPHFDLLIIGTGSGNSILGPDFDAWRVAIVERDVFGGTCLNRGCIPSKMLVYPADVVTALAHAADLGVHGRIDRVDWPAIRDRVFGRIDPIAEGGRRYRAEECGNVTVFAGSARFTGARQVTLVDGHHAGEIVTADQVVIAAGARPSIPAYPGLAEVGFHTSDTIMRIDAVPDRLVILGGGYIAAEMGHVFDAFGSAVTIVNRSGALLRAEDDDVSAAFTARYRERFDLRLGVDVVSVGEGPGGIAVTLRQGSDTDIIVGDMLLVATGRVPNGDELAVEATGVERDAAGYVVVDQYLRTSAPGVWALGDVSNPVQLKHSANFEADAVAHNLVHPDDLRSGRLDPVPHAVFANPQVAAAGLTEREARAAGLDITVATRYYRDTAYGWAMEDTTSFCKLVAETSTRRLLGAHIIGPHAPTLLQQLVQAMRFGISARDLLSNQMWTHPAMPEVIEQALIELG